MADIEQMFYSFSVSEKHRNFLRFLWFEDNDPEKQLVQYRMCRHVLGNSPSPAIATLGLHKSVENSDAEVKTFVRREVVYICGLWVSIFTPFLPLSDHFFQTRTTFSNLLNILKNKTKKKKKHI